MNSKYYVDFSKNLISSLEYCNSAYLKFSLKIFSQELCKLPMGLSLIQDTSKAWLFPSALG